MEEDGVKEGKIIPSKIILNGVLMKCLPLLFLSQYLRDPDGNLYSASQYSLQQSADGSVYLLPRDRKAGGSGGSSSHMNPDYGRSQNHTQDG